MRIFSAPALALMLVLSGASLLNADPIRDQVFLPSNHGSVSGSTNMAQTFTVGTRGTLAGISIPLVAGTDPLGVLVEIRRTTTDGFPDEVHAALAHALVVPSPSAREPLVSADIRAFHVAVRPGDMLAIALVGPGPMNWLIALDDEATYDRGEAFLQYPGPRWRRYPDVFRGFSRGDFLFATSVTPTPEPATLALLAVALGGAGMTRRRRVTRLIAESRARPFAP